LRLFIGSNKKVNSKLIFFINKKGNLIFRVAFYLLVFWSFIFIILWIFNICTKEIIFSEGIINALTVGVSDEERAEKLKKA